MVFTCGVRLYNVIQRKVELTVFQLFFGYFRRAESFQHLYDILRWQFDLALVRGFLPTCVAYH